MDAVIAKINSFFPRRLHDRLLMVGGMVRDILLGIDCQDVDLVAAVPPSELTSLGFRLVESKSTPNIYFLFHKELGKIEVTQLDSLENLPSDLQRRDFTINAIAMTLDGNILDPLVGRGDLAKRILRTCSADSLRNDPVRIFRALRFECEGWRLDPEASAQVLSGDWSDPLQGVPVERFSQEMLKALTKEEPTRFFRRMLEFQVGESYLPEIFRMPEVPAGPLQYHPEGDLFAHAMQALERMSLQSPDVIARFCALFHDLGKLATPETEYPKHHGHEEAGAAAAAAFCKRLRLPVSLQRALQATCRFHGNGNNWEELRESTKIKVAQGAIKGGIEGILPMVVRADSGGVMAGWQETVRIASMNAAQLGLDPALFSDPSFPPESCQQILMQRRVELLRETLKSILPTSPLPKGEG
ncbi:HD domain-containing protein [Geomonas sp.]|uniref:HD domain-containing protein n=1 Tax=Geomonas sp. TaxID=2651584 RepID=UPI002B48338C|nr:HD domain-containing protein [Geomonas sp.]HJV35936.1 HD domain-containing protein [Geomonas sp.]